MKKYILLFVLLFISITIQAQETVVSEIKPVNIGPSVMSGRIVDIAVNPKNPTEFYVAYASGGLWHSDNNGTSLEPVLDSSETQNIGCVSVDWKNEVIYVGTGEVNSSRSSYAGIGILKSSNKGKTWENIGLKDSQHISRIIIDEKNPLELTVAVIGHLYTTNKERGIFKSYDGGKTWQKTLFINDNTGIIDLVASPNNKNTMYAAAWERSRKAWNFVGSGKGSGIYKSTDNGKTWNLLTTEKSGFPIGEGVGRIGLTAFDSEVIYAFLDNQFRREKTDKKESVNVLTKDDFKNMSVETFLNLKDKKLNKFLKQNGFQEKYRAQNVKNMVKKGNIQPSDIAKYLEDANAMLFDTPVKGAELYKSTDGGKTWKKTHKDYIEDIYYSYGYYFGLVKVDPKNSENVYIGGVPILKSKDGGKTFTSIQKDNVHADHHALWISPIQKGHLINGNDGGLNISYDDGETWIKCNQPSVGQFYAVNVDNQANYNVYGGLQDNGVWFGPHNNVESREWTQTGHYAYESIMGGDGMQIMIDDRNPNIVYTGFQFGNYYRLNLATKAQKYIQPKHDLGEAPLRFNWQTPILLSKHNQDILYLGSNKLHRSLDKGDNFKAISEDLTNGGKKGNVAYGTLTSIDESAFQFGELLIGTDDGNVQYSEDGGGSWKLISKNLPQNLWVSRVIFSQFEKGRFYVALNGYRFDDFTPYLFVTEDAGKTWKNISSNLPNHPINVVREDFVDEDILYVGTDNGVFVSFDKGANWQIIDANMPKVAVHDLAIQKQAKEIVIGTHGRSIYVMDLNAVQQYKNVKDSEIAIIDIPEVHFSKNWGSAWSKWIEPNTPKSTISFFVKNAGDYKISILGENEKTLFTTEMKAVKGFNFFEYTISMNEKLGKKYAKKHEDFSVVKAKDGNFYLPKGKYQLEISKGKTKAIKEFEVK
ncbi:VPS10 domain-containing protein [Aureivirga sp. CE67]|uniref:VPS10 domain-containing protein n=1 Tax=Aureivirga sp. CE67 TaxID=1788983 RepID=UPI0018CA11B7|nr:glycosyl hydrolase [Aureivirga sp. CE67]